jgi:superfamily II DNA/RNA helicase
MPPEITRLTEEFLHNPVRVEVAKAATTAATVAQRLVRLRPARKEDADREKRDLLRGILRGEGADFRNAIVFCNRKRDIGAVYKSLQKAGFEAGALHGDLDQSVRTATLEGFRDGAIKVLVASDVAARGLDIPGVSHVVNFDVPIHSEDYVHRIGRTGRAGRTGVAITIALPHEDKHVEKIEKLIGAAIETMDAPGGARALPEAHAEQPRREERPRRAPRSKAAEVAPTGSDPTADRPGADQSREQPRREERPREPARREEHRREQRGGRRDEPVIGLGDHVPAFLLQAVILKRATRREDPEDGADAA